MNSKFWVSPDRRSKNRGNDRRSEDRFRFAVPVSLQVEEGASFRELCEIIDISTFGVRLKMRNQLANLTPVTLKFFLSPSGIAQEQYDFVKAKSVSTSIYYHGDGVEPNIYQTGFLFVQALRKRNGIPIVLSDY
tara:strand:+ start:38 stop:439 length:402 start_codon:yes stop_codon:yes gene_type:complete